MTTEDTLCLETIDRLMKLIETLRNENAALLEIIFDLKGINANPNEENETKIEIPQTMKSFGREPWYMRKTRLEKAASKPKISEIIGGEPAGYSPMSDVTDSKQLELDQEL